MSGGSTHIDRDYTSILSGATGKMAVCSCGWQSRDGLTSREAHEEADEHVRLSES